MYLVQQPSEKLLFNRKSANPEGRLWGIPHESGTNLQFHVIKYINKELKENIAGTLI